MTATVWTAERILDILETKAKGAFVRELGIYDQEIVEKARARREAYIAHLADRSLPVPERTTGAMIRRIDGFDFSSIMRTAFEVKVSRSDWKRESPEKRRAWKLVTHRYIYVSPANVIPVEECPEDCGLWWVHEDPVPGTDRVVPRIEVKRKAPKNLEPSDLPWRLTLNLCFREQRLRKELNRRIRDYQDSRKQCDRLLKDLQELVPGGYTEGFHR